LRAEATTGEQGVTPEKGVTTLSKKRRRRRAHRLPGQPMTAPRCDRGSKACKFSGRYEIAGTVPACSLLTCEEIKVTVWGDPVSCPECGYALQYDDAGDLICNCHIWGGPNVGQEPKKQPDVDAAIQKERRNQAYQRNLRQFFKRGRRG